jgi:hypothetical protein
MFYTSCPSRYIEQNYDRQKKRPLLSRKNVNRTPSSHFNGIIKRKPGDKAIATQLQSTQPSVPLQSHNPRKRRSNPSTHHTNNPVRRRTRSPRSTRSTRRPSRAPTPRRRIRSRLTPNSLDQHTVHLLIILIIVALNITRQRTIPRRRGAKSLNRTQFGHAGGNVELRGGRGEGFEALVGGDGGRDCGTRGE